MSPRRKAADPVATVFDRAMLSVLDVLLEQPGYAYCVGDPGEVLANLAEAAGVPYKTCSLAVLGLEAQGLVMVHRLHGDEARRANKVECVEAC